MAANLKFDVKVRLTPRPTRFARWPDFVFDDPAREITVLRAAGGRGQAGRQGRGRAFPVQLEIEEAAPGMMDATFMFRVFEAERRFLQRLRSPCPSIPTRVTWASSVPKGDEARGMLLTDQDHVLQIVTVDPDGQPVSRDKLEVSLYKVEWKWWWDKSGDSLAQYVSNSSHVPLS